MGMTVQERKDFIMKTERKAEIEGEFRKGFLKGIDPNSPDFAVTYKLKHAETKGNFEETTEYLQGFHDAKQCLKFKAQMDTEKMWTYAELLKLPREEMQLDELYSMYTHDLFAPFQGYAYFEDSDFPELHVEQIAFDYADGYRTKTLGVVSFKGTPVMFFTCAGRGGYEYTQRHILDRDLMRDAVGYLTMTYNQLEGNETFDGDTFVSPTDDAEHLINFYGGRMSIFNK